MADALFQEVPKSQITCAVAMLQTAQSDYRYGLSQECEYHDDQMLQVTGLNVEQIDKLKSILWKSMPVS